MAQDAEHPYYADNKVEWQKCLDVISGESTIKEQGTIYLPQLGGAIFCKLCSV